MPRTFIHICFSLVIYFLIILSPQIPFSVISLLLLLSAELIDLDHLLSKPIYHPKRNPFKTHFLHKNWKLILLVSLVFLFFYPISFLGIGLISHLFIDFIYTKYWLKKLNLI